MGIKITKNEIVRNLEGLDDRAIQAIHATLRYWATQAMTIMRTEAHWTDNTGNARQGLMAKDFVDGEGGSLVMWHSVPYGIWLEVRWHGKYAVVGPVMNQIAPRVQKMAAEAVLKVVQL